MILCDVGPRDGLQNHDVTLPPEARAELCLRLAAAGLRRVEAGSFVHPGRVPQMAGAEEVFAALAGHDEASWSGLVLNPRGLDRALAAGVTDIHLAYPVSDTFGLRNQGQTAAEGSRLAQEMTRAVKAAGGRVNVTLAASFGCPFEGPVDPGIVVQHVALMAAAGADEVLLADSIGVGVPAQVRRLVPAALSARRQARRSASISTTPATRATRTRSRAWRRARRCSTRPSAASAAARSPRTRRATSRPRTSSTCSTARAWRRASTSTR